MQPILFLSDDWLTAVNGLLAADSSAPSPGPDGPDQPGAEPVVVRYLVDQGPPGTGGYDLVLTSDAAVVRRPKGTAAVTLGLSWEVAVAVNQGTESAQAAVLDGRIVVSGDPQTLVTSQDRIVGPNGAVAGLRARTVYRPQD